MNRIGDEPATNDVRGSGDEDPLSAMAGNVTTDGLLKASTPTNASDKKIGRS